jgi:hypothetical protein
VDDRSWDVLQEVTDDKRSAVIFAFKGDPASGRLVVRPRALDGEMEYQVRSLDAGLLGTIRGDVLMADGIELVHGSGSRAHVILIRAK